VIGFEFFAAVAVAMILSVLAYQLIEGL